MHYPQMHRYYWSTLGMANPLVYDGHPPSSEVPFASFTLNVGDNSVCDAHVDGCNLAGGLCLDSPFGDFDYQRGGHLILHELKLVLEVPPGSIVLFPSAIITHENIPIQEGERRHCITAFTPGSLFQWTDHRFLPVTATKTVRQRYSTSLSRAKVPKPDVNVWKTMVGRFPHITKLIKYQGF